MIVQNARSILNDIAVALENLATAAFNAIGDDDRTLTEMWGWNQPAITRHDLATLIRRPIAIINSLDDNVEDDMFEVLKKLPAQITFVQNNTPANMPGGNSYMGYIAIKSLIEKIESTLKPGDAMSLDLKKVDDRNVLPAALIKRLKTVERSIDTLVSDADVLKEKVDLINEAHATAESLPSDLRALRESRQSVQTALKAAQTSQAGAETARKKAEDELSAIAGLQQRAEKLVQSTENAFSAATTKGLGEEFGNRAKGLANDVWLLGAVLAVTLIIGGIITYFRISHINELISAKDFRSDVLWAHVILTIASLAPPVWLAWLVTKQIGQRFRLSEDYAFKASVAKAYAGYSQEAARIDPEFQKQLYHTALARIDEEPLRHIEADSHGSPLHELVGRSRDRRRWFQKGKGEAANEPEAGE